jgi:uncharacterized protein with HEPN domain
MLVAANVAIEFLEDLDLEGLASEPMRFDAIVANIIRIGEAARGSSTRRSICNRSCRGFA